MEERHTPWGVLGELIDSQKISIQPKSAALDLGTGYGNMLYHLYHEFDFSKLVGVEQLRKEMIESPMGPPKWYTDDSYFFNTWEILRDKGKGCSLYQYYSEIVDRVIDSKVKKLSEDEFNKGGPLFFHFGQDIEKYLSNENLHGGNTFDLVVLSKVIHYQEIQNPKRVISQAIERLTTDGLIYISYPYIAKPKEKRKITKRDICDWTKKLEVVKYWKAEGNLFVYVGKKV